MRPGPKLVMFWMITGYHPLPRIALRIYLFIYFFIILTKPTPLSKKLCQSPHKSALLIWENMRIEWSIYHRNTSALPTGELLSSKHSATCHRGERAPMVNLLNGSWQLGQKRNGEGQPRLTGVACADDLTIRSSVPAAVAPAMHGDCWLTSSEGGFACEADFGFAVDALGLLCLGAFFCLDVVPFCGPFSRLFNCFNDFSSQTSSSSSKSSAIFTGMPGFQTSLRSANRNWERVVDAVYFHYRIRSISNKVREFMFGISFTRQFWTQQNCTYSFVSDHRLRDFERTQMWVKYEPLDFRWCVALNAIGAVVFTILIWL